MTDDFINPTKKKKKIRTHDFRPAKKKGEMKYLFHSAAAVIPFLFPKEKGKSKTP